MKQQPRIGKTTSTELNDIAEESYRQITCPHPPQPQREYIITESELTSAWRESLSKKEYDNIRSRPTPTPLGGVDCDTCLFGEQCRVLPYAPPCYNHGPDSPEHTAAQAREKVLEACCKECPISNEIPIDDEWCAESCEGCLVRSVVISLREAQR